MSRSLFRKYRPKLWSVEVGQRQSWPREGQQGGDSQVAWPDTIQTESQCNKQVGGQTSCFLAFPVWFFVLSVKPKTQ